MRMKTWWFQQKYYSIETVETSGTTPPAAQQSAVLTQPNISHTPRSEPTDLALGPKDRPKQPIITFPSRTFGTTKRSFQSSWYKAAPWLEYSVSSDAAFCYPCRVFNSGPIGRSEKTFTQTGFRNWKNAFGKSGVISSHSSCDSHKQATIKWKTYLSNHERHTTVLDRLDSNHRNLVETNQQFIISIIEVLLLCAQQDLPLRGHREYNSHNRGNFLEILSTIAKHDKIVEAKLKNAPRNAIYTSPAIQNQLLQLMGESVRSMVCRAVKEAVFFSLLVDETKDASKVEQISIVLRYVDINTASIYERFLTYVEAESQGAEQITHYITSTLKKYDIDLRNMVSQGYDGASVMSGTNSGVQRRMRDFAPAAIYAHCNVDSVKSVSLAGEFFALVQHLYVFLSSAKNHVTFVNHQQWLYPEKQQRQLPHGGPVAKVLSVQFAPHLMQLLLHCQT